ncbi:hypothetical protein DSO57_1011354 [Entomophthora muscae]|uniref:Uncharacterized protein n=1 Tax=Entomophthora muscae TaxID=34485 RepID=A0ACC2U423_9FUNG|nr:hypothetical protein DSO57_1011354 [Entomophthora muscae]
MCGTAICQICFEPEEGFRLSTCHDFFCWDCFSKYVDDVLLATRGFTGATIKCPSCRQLVLEEDWVPHAEPSTVTRYRVLSDPFRPFMRFCLECGAGNAALARPKLPSSDQDARENWQRQQLQHIKQFPCTQCITCHAPLCLKCGEASHHIGLSCHAYASKLAASPSPRKETIGWILANCWPCPECGIIIQTRVDEGCNKTSCPYCLTSLCGICGRDWSSSNCSYFKCSNSHRTIEA